MKRQRVSDCDSKDAFTRNSVAIRAGYWDQRPVVSARQSAERRRSVLSSQLGCGKGTGVPVHPSVAFGRGTRRATFRKAGEASRP